MLFIYNLFQIIMLPLVAMVFVFRIFAGKEDKKRFLERFGFSSLKRDFECKLIWVHCASVGESLSVLPVVAELVKIPKTKVMLTTGTVTSSILMATKLPKGAFHQFVPIDYAFFVKRFIKYWQPDVSVFVESDLWPNLLNYAPNKILINARMSDKSYAKYKNNPLIAKALLSGFRYILAQSKQDYARYDEFYHEKAIDSGNIKNDGPAPAFNEQELADAKQAFAGRKILFIASTHKGEEEQAIEIYRKVKAKNPETLLMIAPRHPVRGDEVANVIKSQGLNFIQRSKNKDLTQDLANINSLDVYLADTLGEIGLWFQLSDIVLMGGSLVEWGGHNPLEPLKAGKITCCGPNMFNFKNMTDDLLEKKVLFQFNTNDELANFISDKIADKEFKEVFSVLAKKTMLDMSGATEVVLSTINKMLVQVKS